MGLPILQLYSNFFHTIRWNYTTKYVFFKQNLYITFQTHLHINLDHIRSIFHGISILFAILVPMSISFVAKKQCDFGTSNINKHRSKPYKNNTFYRKKCSQDSLICTQIDDMKFAIFNCPLHYMCDLLQKCTF